MGVGVAVEDFVQEVEVVELDFDLEQLVESVVGVGLV